MTRTRSSRAGDRAVPKTRRPGSSAQAGIPRNPGRARPGGSQPRPSHSRPSHFRPSRSRATPVRVPRPASGAAVWGAACPRSARAGTAGARPTIQRAWCSQPSQALPAAPRSQCGWMGRGTSCLPPAASSAQPPSRAGPPPPTRSALGPGRFSGHLSQMLSPVTVLLTALLPNRRVGLISLKSISPVMSRTAGRAPSIGRIKMDAFLKRLKFSEEGNSRDVAGCARQADRRGCNG